MEDTIEEIKSRFGVKGVKLSSELADEVQKMVLAEYRLHLKIDRFKALKDTKMLTIYQEAQEAGDVAARKEVSSLRNTNASPEIMVMIHIHPSYAAFLTWLRRMGYTVIEDSLVIDRWTSAHILNIAYAKAFIGVLNKRLKDTSVSLRFRKNIDVVSRITIK